MASLRANTTSATAAVLTISFIAHAPAGVFSSSSSSISTIRLAGDLHVEPSEKRHTVNNESRSGGDDRGLLPALYCADSMIRAPSAQDLSIRYRTGVSGSASSASERLDRFSSRRRPDLLIEPGTRSWWIRSRCNPFLDLVLVGIKVFRRR